VVEGPAPDVEVEAGEATGLPGWKGAAFTALLNSKGLDAGLSFGSVGRRGRRGSEWDILFGSFWDWYSGWFGFSSAPRWDSLDFHHGYFSWGGGCFSRGLVGLWRHGCFRFGFQNLLSGTSFNLFLLFGILG
jgi:hypothetical protein